MFTTCSFHPQIYGALSQIGGLINNIRTSSNAVIQRTQHSKCMKKHHHRVLHTDIGANVNALAELIERLPSDLSTRCLFPLLGHTEPKESQWLTNVYTSKRTFSENKRSTYTRFRPTSLCMNLVYDILSSSSLQSNNIFSHGIQKRGFKTHRSTKSTTMTSNPSILGDLKKSVSDHMKTKEAVSNERLKTLLSDVEPDTQDKLKIAFAEGYTAHSKHDSEPKNTLASRLLKFVYVLAFIWLILQGIQIIGGAASGGVGGFGVLKRDRYEVNPEDIHVNFNDVKGVDEAKQELQDIVEFLKDPEKFTSLGAKLPKGVLLVGQPGIGKTLLARAVAGEAGVPFFQASGSEFDELFVGTGAKRIRQLFAAAKSRSPCVIFIDEIDTVGAKRTNSQIHPYANQTINQLLAEMDGFKQNEGVIVLGATNRRDNLDKAILRPGRFDVEVQVNPPDVKGRKEILEHYLNKIIVDPDLDIDKLAHGTYGFTGADLENLVNQAALKAAMDYSTQVTIEHIDYARDKVLMGPAKKSKIPDEETNWNTAYHEAGHALVAYFTKNSTPIHKVTIIPRGSSLGHTAFIPDHEIYGHTKAELLAEMDVGLGGRVGEEVIYGSDKVTTGASSDFQKATAIATGMVKRWGMTDKIGVRVFSEGEAETPVSPTTQEQVDAEIKRLLQESLDRARHIIKAHGSEHRALAKALMKYETLDLQQISTILEGGSI